ncbi:hypothetical protein N5923_09230 [Erwiniaceae bacterium BAC15a-03b]|uniref:Surface presentation of antigen domain-containing protein n=1 Tax=Winslowiella arboricola TaxID=2978220 RepID=A0A9J6PJX6_9GAMM|nr:hypothetical protein [Winslowiella arboricola]MCU5773764.1 hypothetical protein [Winslowiella arboricola]MCU5777674.1 hypothetical protein [Winslowiella arboricola]
MANVIVAPVARPLLPVAKSDECNAGELDKQLEKAWQQQPEDLPPMGWALPQPIPAAEKPPVALNLSLLKRDAEIKTALTPGMPPISQQPVQQPLPLTRRHAPAIASISPPPEISAQPVVTERPLPPLASRSSDLPLSPERHEVDIADKPRSDERRIVPIPAAWSDKAAPQPWLRSDLLPMPVARHKAPLPALPVAKPAASEDGQHRISYAFTQWGSEHRVQLTAVRDGNQPLVVVMNPSDPLVSRRLQEAIVSSAPASQVILGDETADDQRRNKPELPFVEDDE